MVKIKMYKNMHHFSPHIILFTYRTLQFTWIVESYAFTRHLPCNKNLIVIKNVHMLKARMHCIKVGEKIPSKRFNF